MRVGFGFVIITEVRFVRELIFSKLARLTLLSQGLEFASLAALLADLASLWVTVGHNDALQVADVAELTALLEPGRHVNLSTLLHPDRG
jgi:hypothetical protein